MKPYAAGRPRPGTNLHVALRLRGAALQVLEILNDAEVRRLHEGQPPVPLPSAAQESLPEAAPPRVPFWQWAAKQRDSPPPPVVQAVK